MQEPITDTERGTARDEHDLVSVVVEYETGPDQQTIYPPDADEMERMTHWISGDVDCYVDLASMR